MRTREEAIKNAARALVDGAAMVAQLTPREQAEAAWTPTSRHTVDQLEDLIRETHGLGPKHLAESA